MKMMRSIFLILMLSGLAAAIYGMTMPLYTNEPAYQSCYQDISYESDGADVAAERFKQCRKQFLSPKISVIRYSATTFLLAGFAFGVAIFGVRSLRAPQKKWIIVTVGLMAAIAMTASFVADLFWNNSLEVFPHWSDSLGIPLAMTPVILVFGLLILGLNAFLIRKCKAPPTQPIFAGSWKQLNKFVLAEFFVAALLILDAAIVGDFFGLMPNLLWLAFFAFVMSWRSQPLASTT